MKFRSDQIIEILWNPALHRCFPPTHSAHVQQYYYICILYIHSQYKHSILVCWKNSPNKRRRKGAFSFFFFRIHTQVFSCGDWLVGIERSSWAKPLPYSSSYSFWQEAERESESKDEGEFVEAKKAWKGQWRAQNNLTSTSILLYYSLSACHDYC